MDTNSNGHSPEAREHLELDPGVATVAWFRSAAPDVELATAEAAAALPYPALDVLAGIADDGPADAVFELGPGSWQAITTLRLIDIATFGPDLTEQGRRVSRLALDAIRVHGLKSFSSLVPPSRDIE
jgi:hypothetical protein